MKRRFLFVCLTACTAFFSGCTSPDGAPKSGIPPAETRADDAARPGLDVLPGEVFAARATRLAKPFILALIQGEPEPALERMSPELRDTVSELELRAFSDFYKQQYGELCQIEPLADFRQNPCRMLVYKLTFRRELKDGSPRFTDIPMQIAFAESNGVWLIVAFQIRPML